MHVFDGEFEGCISDINFDNPVDVDPVLTENENLREEMEEKDRLCTNLSLQVSDLEAQNKFLSSHATALEQECVENRDKVDKLSRQVSDIEQKEKNTSKSIC